MELKKAKAEELERNLREIVKGFALEQRTKCPDILEDEDPTPVESFRVSNIKRLFEKPSTEKEDIFFGLLNKHFGLTLDFFVVEFTELVEGVESIEPVLVIKRKQVLPMSLLSLCVRVLESFSGALSSTLPIELQELITSGDYLLTSEMRSQSMFYFYRYDSVRQCRLLMDALKPVTSEENMKEVSRLFAKLLELPWILYSLENIQKPQEYHEQYAITGDTEAVCTCKWKTFTYEMWIECTFRRIDDRLFELSLIKAQDLNFNFLIRKHAFGIHAEETLVVRPS